MDVCNQKAQHIQLKNHLFIISHNPFEYPFVEHKNPFLNDVNKWT